MGCGLFLAWGVCPNCGAVAWQRAAEWHAVAALLGLALCASGLGLAAVCNLFARSGRSEVPSSTDP